MNVFQAAGAALLIASLAIGPHAVSSAAAREAKTSSPFSEFRLPWRSEKARKVKRPRSERSRGARPKTERPKAERSRSTPPTRKAVVDPRDAPLPAPRGPLALAPFGTTPRISDGWTALAAQVPPPEAPPLLPPEGPAPAAANVMALWMTRPAARPEVPAPPVDEDVAGAPMPRERPADLPGGEIAAPAPAGVPTLAALPPAAMPPPADARPEPSSPDLPLPELAREDDPDCAALEEMAVTTPSPAIEGPGVCGSRSPVEMTAVKLADGRRIDVTPAARLRCGMAREIAAYVRDDLVPAAAGAGDALEQVGIAGSFTCRGRNGAAGGKMSEHGRANAIDLSTLGLRRAGDIMIFSSDMPPALAKAAKDGACRRFSTVLGPGSDGHHETHLHLDLQPRRSRSTLCQWDKPAVAETRDKDGDDEEGAASAREDAPKGAKAQSAVPTPLPRPVETP